MNQIFVEQAPTYFEAERKAREKYGERINIFMHETVKIKSGFLNLFSQDGVRITGTISKFNQVQYRDAAVMSARDEQSALRLAATSLPTVRPASNTAVSPKSVAQANTLNFAEEKEKILAMAGKDNSLKDVLTEVRAIKDKLENSGLSSSQELNPTLNRIDDLLILNDFSASYRKTLLERVRKEVSLDTLNNFDVLQNKVLEWIGESIRIYENDKFNVKPRIMILVGPTGVGKTTTVAKLAANFGIDEKGRHKRRVVLVTIDAYRIGAKEQLEKIGDVMEVSCFSATDYDEMKKIIALNSEGTDLFLIDTIGRNPRDMVLLGEMKQILDACGTIAEVHLVTAATTKSSDLADILRHFESFNYKSVIVTKLDETIRTGNVIGALSEKGKSISYITNGQTVPTDIKRASVIQFLINLEGFKVNRIRLEEKFPDRGLEQMQQWR